MVGRRKTNLFKRMRPREVSVRQSRTPPWRGPMFNKIRHPPQRSSSNRESLFSRSTSSAYYEGRTVHRTEGTWTMTPFARKLFGLALVAAVALGLSDAAPARQGAAAPIRV